MGKNVAIIYDRLNPLTLGSVIALAKEYVDGVYVVNDRDPRVSYITGFLGAELIGINGRPFVEQVKADGAYVFLYGDGTHCPDKIPLLLDGLKKGADVTMLSRSGVDNTQVNESVLYLNNKKAKANNSEFMACSAASLEKLSSEHKLKSPEELPGQLLGFAKCRGLAIVQAQESVATFGLHRIGVVVPAYNEERLIGPTLMGIPAYVSKIYVIDDCSTDNMPAVIKGIDDPRIVYLRHEVNKGVGAAIITGYKRALEDGMGIVAVMAGDDQMDPEQLPRLLLPIVEGRADYTKGNRLLSKDMRKGMSAWRSLGNFMLTMVTKIGSGYWHVTDPQNGYTAISRQALESLDLDSVYTYYGYCNDLLIKLNAFGMRTMDVVMPARYGDEKSKIKYSRFILKVAPMIFRGFLWRLKTKYIILDFNPLVLFYFFSMVMIPAGIVLGAWIAIETLIGAVLSSHYQLIALSLMLWGILFLLLAMMLDMQENKSRNIT